MDAADFGAGGLQPPQLAELFGCKGEPVLRNGAEALPRVAGVGAKVANSALAFEAKAGSTVGVASMLTLDAETRARATPSVSKL